MADDRLQKIIGYHVIILHASSFLEKTSHGISNIFCRPVRISGPKCLEPDKFMFFLISALTKLHHCLSDRPRTHQQDAFSPNIIEKHIF